MRPARKSLISLLAVGVFVSGLASCTSDDTTEAVPEETPTPGGTFRQGLVRLASEDPAKASTVSERLIADELYDGLTKWNPQTLQAEPALAQAWEPSPDLQQWTFHLRADAKAANGELTTATDVKKSLEHVARKASGAALADQLATVKGFTEFSNNPAVPDLAGIVVVDHKTIRIELTSPYAEFPLLLGNPALAVVHYNADGSTSTTGPFRVAERTPDVWKLSKSPSSAALLDGIEARFFDDATASYEALKAGVVDWTPITPDKANEAGKAYGTQLFKPSLRTLSLSFNTMNPKLSDVRFRQAIVRAIDRVAVATKLDVDATALNGVVPPDVVGDQGGGCGTACFHDVDAARDLVKAVFLNGAPPITIDIAAASPFTEASTKQITDDLAAVGVMATIRPTPAERYGAVTVQPDRELFQTSWSAAYPSPGAFLDPLYRSTSPSNVSGLKSVDVDTPLANAFKSTSPVEQVGQFKSAEDHVMAQLPIVPIAAFPVDSVQRGGVRGIAVLPTGNFDATTVWLTNAGSTNAGSMNGGAAR